MAGPLPGAATVNVTDTFHPKPLDLLHKYEANFLNTTNHTCNKSSPDNCTIDVLTYTSNYYAKVKKYSRGIVAVGAQEIQSKILSR